jgi:hypothetical protein
VGLKKGGAALVAVMGRSPIALVAVTPYFLQKIKTSEIIYLNK